MCVFRHIWPNRHRGEIVGHINGRRRCLVLSLAALARLESCYDDTDILVLMRRFAEKGIGAQDVINILRAGLCGGDDPLGASDTPLIVKGGFTCALELAAQLIEAAFGIIPSSTNDTK